MDMLVNFCNNSDWRVTAGGGMLSGLRTVWVGGRSISYDCTEEEEVEENCEVTDCFTL